MKERKEQWADVVGYEGLYKVSSLGDVVNAKGKVLKPRKNNRGYLRCLLTKDKKPSEVLIHKIVGEAFLGKPQINHIDGNKDNNELSNLEWISASGNIKHAYDNGLMEEVRKSARINIRKLHNKNQIV